MAQDKWIARLEAKLDALLEANKVDMAQFDDMPAVNRGQARKLTQAEQDAIDNAPKAEANVPPQENGPRVTAQNAPDTSSSVPSDAVNSVPPEARGNVTVETTEADGDVTVDTIPASEAKKGKK